MWSWKIGAAKRFFNRFCCRLGIPWNVIVCELLLMCWQTWIIKQFFFHLFHLRRVFWIQLMLQRNCLILNGKSSEICCGCRRLFFRWVIVCSVPVFDNRTKCILFEKTIAKRKEWNREKETVVTNNQEAIRKGETTTGKENTDTRMCNKNWCICACDYTWFISVQ